MKRHVGNVYVRTFDLDTQVAVGVARGTHCEVVIRPVARPYQSQQKREAARMAIKALREGLRHARQ